VTDPSRCCRAHQCEAAENVDHHGQAVTVGALSDRPLCRACEQVTADALTAAPALYARLRQAALDRGNTPPGQRVTRSRGGSFGLNLGPLDLAEQLHWHTTAWADQVLWTAGRPGTDRTSQPEHGQVTDACAILGRYLSVWIAHDPAEFQVTRTDADPDNPKATPTDHTVTASEAGWQACAWLVAWRHAAERTLRLPLLIHYPPEPCPACDTPRALKRKDGDDKVTCMVCGKSWTLDMYETFVHAWIGAR
jgi:hypothetical protein